MFLLVEGRRYRVLVNAKTQPEGPEMRKTQEVTHSNTERTKIRIFFLRIVMRYVPQYEVWHVGTLVDGIAHSTFLVLEG